MTRQCLISLERSAFMEQYPASKSLGWDGTQFVAARDSQWQHNACEQLNPLWQCWKRARASLPDGCAMVPVALTEEMRQAFNRVDVLRYPANNRQLFKAKHSWAAMLAAAPTVKAEQVQCSTCNDTAMIGDLPIECPDCCHDEAPSLPAAGSTNAPDVLLPALRQYRHNCGGDELIPGYDYEETNRIVAALSTQQSARMAVTRDQIRDVFIRNGFTVKGGQTDLKPYVYAAAQELLALANTPQSAHVSVPRELLADLISSDHDTKIQAERALYTLLGDGK